MTTRWLSQESSPRGASPTEDQPVTQEQPLSPPPGRAAGCTEPRGPFPAARERGAGAGACFSPGEQGADGGQSRGAPTGRLDGSPLLPGPTSSVMPGRLGQPHPVKPWAPGPEPDHVPALGSRGPLLPPGHPQAHRGPDPSSSLAAGGLPLGRWGPGRCASRHPRPSCPAFERGPGSVSPTGRM